MSTVRVTGVLPGETLSDFSALSESLAKHGYAVVPGFLDREVGDALLEEAFTLWEDGEYRRAAIGRGDEQKVRAEIRSDHVLWLDEMALSPGQKRYWDRMESLRAALNRDLFLGLFDFEAHLACFPEGTRYRAHLDRHRDSEARTLSAIVYLNEGWRPEDGGSLRLYTDRELGVDGPWIDIVPEFGKLVIFLSAVFWHEVLPASRDRHSITGWFRRRVEDLPLL